MSKIPGFRQYITVKECEKAKIEHQHMIESDGRTYCNGVGEYLDESSDQKKEAGKK
jgi:hypothetical protein